MLEGAAAEVAAAVVAATGRFGRAASIGLVVFLDLSIFLSACWSRVAAKMTSALLNGLARASSLQERNSSVFRESGAVQRHENKYCGGPQKERQSIVQRPPAACVPPHGCG